MFYSDFIANSQASGFISSGLSFFVHLSFLGVDECLEHSSLVPKVLLLVEMNFNHNNFGLLSGDDLIYFIEPHQNCVRYRYIVVRIPIWEKSW